MTRCSRRGPTATGALPWPPTGADGPLRPELGAGAGEEGGAMGVEETMRGGKG